MAFVILFAVVLVVAIAYDQQDSILFQNPDLLTYVGLGLVLTLVGLLGVLLAGLIAHFIGSKLLKKEWSSSGTWELVALRNGEGMSGHFFLGTGFIEGHPSYFFYKKSGKGLSADNIRADHRTTIFEEEGRTVGELRQFALDLKNRRFWKWFALHDPSYRWEFYIPAGSVAKGFNI